jgi:EAL domain-containing protein (putative c-di-GMP-specific phosphodiesterase class I)
MTARGKILLVDDDPIIRAAYGRALTRRGHQVRVVEGGEQALALLELETFDAILSDITMAGLDGIGLLRALRVSGRQIPVVLMTADARVERAIDAVELGAVKFLVKPVELDPLWAALDEAVTRGQQARRSREVLAAAAAVEGERALLARRLDEAVEDLTLAFQPIWVPGAARPVAFEALLRSAHPELRGPLQILDAAERLGRLAEVGRQVRALAAAAFALAPAEATLFVNVHPLDLLDDDLFAPDSRLAQVASRVVLEVTERAAVREIPDLQARLSALRSLGFRLALDDLGAGYAGLATLADLQPELVKLDMALVRDLHLDERRRRLVGAIIELCHSQGALVVGEGVEVEGERDALTALHCDLLQGYLLARPHPEFPQSAPPHPAVG